VAQDGRSLALVSLHRFRSLWESLENLLTLKSNSPWRHKKLDPAHNRRCGRQGYSAKRGRSASVAAKCKTAEDKERHMEPMAKSDTQTVVPGLPVPLRRAGSDDERPRSR
jgi:hypothetical protein